MFKNVQYKLCYSVHVKIIWKDSISCDKNEMFWMVKEGDTLS